eukprot:07061.XXX_309028_309132_1 [CDS] Oithona nana genome sequencing.
MFINVAQYIRLFSHLIMRNESTWDSGLLDTSPDR